MTYLLSNTAESGHLNPIGLAFTVGMCLLLLVLHRRFVLLPIILTACFMTCGQELVVAGLNFTVLRILVVVAYVRVLLRSEHRSYQWHRLDTVILLWCFSSIFFFTLLWQSSGAVINRLGVACDTAGLYFVFRIIIRDIEDVTMACRLFAVMLIPLAILMTYERITGGRNLFYALGGVPEFSEIRRGAIRCQGPFKHPILAGTFGAVWPPLLLGLWWQDRRSGVLAVLGILSCLAITVTAGSSGPILTFSCGLLAIAMWAVRKQMRLVRWMILATIVSLHCVMKDPVWFIFARVNVLSGSTGWHRSNLIDKTITHFSDWWLCGTKEVGKWGVWAGDITNQYILEGVNGGILTVLLFVAVITVTYSSLGKAVKRVDCAFSRKLPWAFGCALFAHTVTFFSVSYFDQNVVNFYLLLAMAPVFTVRKSVAIRTQRTPSEDVNDALCIVGETA